MKRTALWLALPAALITALLYPRFFTNSIQPPSDPAAIDAARAILTQLGIDPAPYTFAAERSFDEDQYRSIRRFQPSRLAALLSPLEVEVTGKSPKGNLKLVLSERLRPIEWSASGIDAAKLAPSSVWLQVFAGPEASCFGGPSTKPGSKDKDEQRWTCRDTSVANREAQFTIGRDAKVPREARLTLTSPGGGKGMVFEWLQDTFSVLGILTMVVLAPAAFIYTITRRKRHRDHLKSAVKISLAFLIVGLALWAAGMLPRMNEDSDERIAFFLGRTLALIVTLAPGFALVTGWQARSWLGVSLIAEPRWFSRPVGLELLHGLALGSLIACAATLCAWAASPWGALPAIVPLDHVFSRFQFTSAVSRLPSSALMLFFFFGVMVPWVLRGQPSRRKTGFTILSGISLTTLGLHFVSGNGLASLVASTATIGLLWWAYRYSGLLATLTAIPAAAVVPALALSLARRDGAAFVSEAVPFAAALGVALLLQRFGRTADVACLTNEIVRRNTPAPDDIRPERERLLTEVSLAREAQQSLLPAHPPDLPGYSIAAACIPAGEVGGDLYDYLPFPPNRTAFCVADVSGKGVTASVYNSYAKGMLAALAQRNASLETLAAELNGHFLETAQRKAFFTLVVALLDPHSRALQILRLGHNPPLLLRAAGGESIWLRPPGLGVGLATNKSLMRILKVDTLQLEPGDTLVLYSDGLTEAMNPASELYGEDRLRDLVERNAHLDAPALNTLLLSEVEAFRNGAEPNDDLTLLTLRVSPS